MRPPPKAKEPKQNKPEQNDTPSALAAYVKQKHCPETTLPSCPEDFAVESTSDEEDGEEEKRDDVDHTNSAVGRISRLTLSGRLRQVKHGEIEQKRDWTLVSDILVGAKPYRGVAKQEEQSWDKLKLSQ